ncbi:hypothetical protein FRC11_005552 [Ceratobasidium sp. 423]|nr:hypothetical protein FRC11_005552 [Ceratobasidium sp. 423]
MLPGLLSLALGAAAVLASKGGSKPQTCIVPSHGNASISDTPAVHAAFQKCGKGGRIIFSENTNYTLRELTKMTPCIGCTVQLEGTIQLADNITYWLKNETTNTPNITSQTFPHLVYYPFQDTVAYLILKDWSHGTLISKTGKGLIDGLAQAWWNAAAGQDPLFPKTLRRPVLITLDGANNVTVDNIAMKNPAMWFNWVIDSKNVIYKNIRLSALSANKNPAANADGWDVGSLAQYPGVLDIVEHVKVKNITFAGDTSNGARIKVWSGPVGSAIVNDIHYEDLWVEEVTNPIVVDSCYFSSAYCATGKPVASITNVTVTNVTGSSTGKVVSSIICPEGSTCDIKLKNINIVPKTGDAPVYRCFSVTSEDLGVNCTYPTVVNGTFKWPA